MINRSFADVVSPYMPAIKEGSLNRVTFCALLGAVGYVMCIVMYISINTQKILGRIVEPFLLAR